MKFQHLLILLCCLYAAYMKCTQQNCQICDRIDKSKCKKCKQGSYLNRDNKCYACGCDRCSIIFNGKTKCFNCPANCRDCYQIYSGDVICSQKQLCTSFFTNKMFGKSLVIRNNKLQFSTNPNVNDKWMIFYQQSPYYRYYNDIFQKNNMLKIRNNSTNNCLAARNMYKQKHKLLVQACNPYDNTQIFNFKWLDDGSVTVYNRYTMNGTQYFMYLAITQQNNRQMLSFVKEVKENKNQDYMKWILNCD